MTATVIATESPAVIGRFGVRVYCAATNVYVVQPVEVRFGLIVKAAPRRANVRGHGTTVRSGHASPE